MTPPVDARRKLLQWIGRGLRAARLVLGSLRVKAGLAIVAAFAAGFTLLAAIVMYSAEQETRQLIGNQQTVIAFNVANDIDEKIAMARDMLLDTARRLPLDRLHDAAEMETFIRSNGAMFGLFDDIVIHLPDGRVVADWPVAPRRRGTDRSSAEHFKVAMATGKPHISKPFEAPLLKTPVIVMTVPVLDSAGRPVTVLSGLIHLLRPNFLGGLATRRIGVSGYFVLTDGDGTIMVHPRSDRIMTHASREGSGAAIERTRNGSQGHYEGREAKLYAASIVKSTGWALLAVLPQDEAYRPLAPMRARLAIIYVALLAALGVLFWLLMGRLLAPLTALRAAVQAYGAGADRAAPLDLGRVPRGSAEIDAVADALRRAVERIEATAAQLRDERAFSAAIVEHAGTLVLVLDREGRFVRFNRACEELSGYSFAEVEGKFPWDTVLPPEDANTIKEEAFEALARAPQALSGRYVNDWLTKARERRLIEWHNTLLLDAGGATQFMVSVGIDITEAHLAQAALNRSKAQLRLVLDNVPALIAYYGTDERLIFANRRYSEFYGVAPHRAAGLSVAEVLGPENYRVARAQFERVLAGEAVSYVGQRTSKDGAARFIEATAMPDLDAHGALRGFFWLALDITQRRKADQARRDSEAQLREAQRIAHVGSWDLDLVTDRLDWSDEIFRIFEIGPARFGASYEAFLNAIHPEDRDAVNRAYAGSVANRTPYEIVHRLQMADGRIKWVRERCETLYDEAGKPLRSAGTVQDITAQAEAEARLRASEARLRTILDAEPECVKLLDRDGNLLDMNPAGLAMIEADSLAQVLGQRVRPIVSETDRAAFEDMIEAVFRGENRTLLFQIRGFKGTLRHLEMHSVPIWDERREHVAALLGVTRDITARKAMEDALIHNERHVRVLLDSMPLAVGHADAAERITFANRMYRAYYSGDADPVGFTIRQEIGDDRYAFVQPYIRQVLAGEAVQFERSFAHSDGTTGTRSVRYIPELSADGQVIGFFALIEDITARKRAEVQLHTANAQLQMLIQCSPLAVYTRDANGLLTSWNPAAENMYGWKAAEVLGKPLPSVPEEARAESDGLRARLLAGETFINYKARRRRRDGSPIDVDAFLGPLRDASGNINGIIAVVADITERRRAEQVERDSRHRLQSILDSIFARVGLFTLEGVVIEANRALVEVAGQKREDVIGKPLWDAYWWSYSPVVQEQVREALRRAAQGETVRDDFRVRLAENVFITIDATFGPVRDEKGRVTQLVGSSVDITERKLTEEHLRQSEQRYGELVSAVPGVVYSFRVDAEGRRSFPFVSEGIGGLAGLSPGEVVADAEVAFQRIPAEAMPAMEQSIRTSLEELALWMHEFPIRTASGEEKWLRGQSLPRREADGATVWHGVFIDITERKRAEDRTRAALAEKEVLLKEIYHRVKNNLQVVSSLLNMQERGVADEQMKALLAESANRVKSMALVHEQLYRSQDLSNIALTEYLRQLAAHLQYAHRPLSTRVPLRLEVADLKLGIETAVPLGLIVNELVSNAYKHGYGPDAARGEIVLRVESLDDGRVRLEVSGDGRGLPEGFEPTSVTSLGMQLVVTLAAQLAGELRHRSEAGRTSFEVVFRPEAREAERLVV